MDGFFGCDLESRNCYLATLRIRDILPFYACVDKKIVFKYFFRPKFRKIYLVLYYSTFFKHRMKIISKFMAQSVGSSDRYQRCNKGVVLTNSNTWKIFHSKCGFVATDMVEQEWVRMEMLRDR